MGTSSSSPTVSSAGKRGFYPQGPGNVQACLPCPGFTLRARGGNGYEPFGLPHAVLGDRDVDREFSLGVRERVRLPKDRSL